MGEEHIAAQIAGGESKMEFPVGIGEYKVAESPSVIVTRGLGSCVGVVMYDPVSRIGGLAHIMLPSSQDFSTYTNPYKFADLAIPALINDMRNKGCKTLQARIAGGARMFALSSDRIGFDVGNRNTAQVKITLQKYSVPILAEDVGGSFGRTVTLDTTTGVVRVRTVGQGERAL